MEQYNIDGFLVTVERKRGNKHLYLRLKEPDGVVSITCPAGTKDEEIVSMVRSHRDWILLRQARLRQRPDLQYHPYVTGDTLPVWGEQWALEVRTGGNGYATLTGDPTQHHFCLEIGGSTTQQRESVLEEWYRRELRRVMPAMLADCERRSGLHAEEWRVRKMTSRWGSCKPSERRITLNTALVKYPPQCLDMVICHELTHFLVPNHSPAFYRRLETFCPNWREADRLLKGREGTF
jgi:hypothetical protein